MNRPAVLIAVLALLIRAPFLDQPLQGDDPYYLYGAEHAQIDPWHPLDTRYAFQGQMVDMRGHPHGPMNSWILGALLALFGDVKEVPFHAAYALFSVGAALAMWSLARRFCDKPVWATLLFIAVPPFVVNGNSFESDLPFLAFWLTAIALFLRAADERSTPLLTAAAIASAFAALQAYQAVLMAPILAVYLWRNRRDWLTAWAALLVVPATIAAWQLWEWQTTGQLPAAMLIGYVQSGSLQSPVNKLGSAAALVGHGAWIAGPLLVLRAAWFRPAWRWGVAAFALIGAAWLDSNPLFWASVAVGVLLLLFAARREFLAAWIWIFFLGALVIFYAGAARYLLPIAAPVAILVARAATPRFLAAGFALQLALSIGLATANYQHWQATKVFAAEVARQANGRRVWTNAELGLRYYLEADGALPLLREQALQAGELVVTSELVQSVEPSGRLARLSEILVSPAVPLRLISLEGGSGYSTSAKGLLPFEVSREPVDRLRIEAVGERMPELSFLDPREAKAPDHVIAGLFPDGWMAAEASVILKTPEKVASLGVDLFIPPGAPARRVELLADGVVAAANTYAQPGAYRLETAFQTTEPSVTVGLRVDATHRAPPDERDLGIVIVGVGMR